MASLILVADDTGLCTEEVGAIVRQARVPVLQARTVEECVERARARTPNVIIVYAAMNKAFSLLRLLRHSPDLSGIPLMVVADAEQEALVARHRELPSRADRYLLRPIDSELFRSVVEEFLGTNPEIPMPPPLPPKAQVSEPSADFDAPPDAYQQMEEEIRRYRARVTQLEKDMKSLHMVSKELGRLRAENDALKQQLAAEKEARQAAPAPDFSDMYSRLEQGYKETIDDLDRLVREKDEIISRLAATDERGGQERQTLMARIEEEQGKTAELRKALRHLATVIGELEGIGQELALEQAVEEWTKKAGGAEAERSFSQDDKTVIVDPDTLNKRLSGGNDGH